MARILQTHRHLDEDLVKKIFLKIIIAVSHLHNADYVHLDINAENV